MPVPVEGPADPEAFNEVSRGVEVASGGPMPVAAAGASGPMHRTALQANARQQTMTEHSAIGQEQRSAVDSERQSTASKNGAAERTDGQERRVARRMDRKQSKNGPEQCGPVRKRAPEHKYMKNMIRQFLHKSRIS